MASLTSPLHIAISFSLKMLNMEIPPFGSISTLNVTKLIQISLQYVPLQVECAASSFANDLDEAGQHQFVSMVRHRLAGDVVQRRQVAERDVPSVRGNLLENLHTTRLRKHLGHVGKLFCGQPVL